MGGTVEEAEADPTPIQLDFILTVRTAHAFTTSVRTTHDFTL